MLKVSDLVGPSIDKAATTYLNFTLLSVMPAKFIGAFTGAKIGEINMKSLEYVSSCRSVPWT